MWRRLVRSSRVGMVISPADGRRRVNRSVVPLVLWTRVCGMSKCGRVLQRRTTGSLLRFRNQVGCRTSRSRCPGAPEQWRRAVGAPRWNRHVRFADTAATETTKRRNVEKRLGKAVTVIRAAPSASGVRAGAVPLCLSSRLGACVHAVWGMLAVWCSGCVALVVENRLCL